MFFKFILLQKSNFHDKLKTRVSDENKEYKRKVITMNQKESLNFLNELQKELENMTPSEKEELRKRIDEFCDKEYTPEEQEENELKRQFLKIII